MEEELKNLKDVLKAVFGVKADATTAESTQALIATLKTKSEDSFNEGLKDGEKSAKVKVLSNLKASLGVNLNEADLESSETLLTKIKSKFETPPVANPNAKDSAEYKELKKAFDTMVTAKDEEIQKAKNESILEIESIRKDAILKEILFNANEGFLIPEDNEAELKDRIEVAKAFMERKGFNYEKQDDGRYYRVSEHGTIVRDGNNKVSYEDDLRKALSLSFQKGIAGEKQGTGIPRDAGKSGNEGQKGGSYDWTKATAKNPKFEIPKNTEDANKILFDPIASLEEREAVTEFMELGGFESK